MATLRRVYRVQSPVKDRLDLGRRCNRKLDIRTWRCDFDVLVFHHGEWYIYQGLQIVAQVFYRIIIRLEKPGNGNVYPLMVFVIDHV